MDAAGAGMRRQSLKLMIITRRVDSPRSISQAVRRRHCYPGQTTAFFQPPLQFPLQISGYFSVSVSVWPIS